ncbi:Crp/Fnr family transcriptional regulator [uncultured Roseobacter sp.]|uniref:Crp/Fnr family transcriptional regulator n=1 Tax=uncultured Roseobacter sp. TaxID=114847 RepID=UPI002601A2DA|nr:cyclic nucleotide-binding domain-containing protein [uncultured Roseobacter sp.]
MFEAALSPEYLVYLAGAFYIAGLAITNQIVLRLLILAGTGVYLIYYSTVADNPLWPAIYVSMLIGLANVGGLTSLIARNSRLAIPAAHADIYFDFPRLPPGDFRALMKLARRYNVTEDMQITAEGDAGDKLYFIISGSTLARKGDQAFVLPPKIFIGEIAFLIGRPSSASTWLEEGCEVLEWRFDDLRRKCARNSRFKLALEAAISVDLASKVARSMGKDAVPVQQIPTPMVEALSGVRRGQVSSPGSSSIR